MIKNYVLDTNLLMQNPNVLFGFKDNNVYITGTTLQELDKHKSDAGEAGYNARETGRILSELMENYGDLTKGVETEDGGKIFVLADGVSQDLLPEGFSISVPDNRIISSCLYLEKQSKNPVILLANDTYMRLNASACGLQSQPVRNDIIEDTNYTGHTYVELFDNTLINKLYNDKHIMLGELTPFMRDDEPALIENEFITITSGQSSAMTIHKKGQVHLIKATDKYVFGGVKPINLMQNYALWALMNPEIDLVILKGPAGTAKTFLSLAAGLSQSFIGQRCEGDIYDQILISRPNVDGSDSGFGYLPGDLNQKMAPLLASYTDNLEALFKSNIGKDKSKPTTRSDIAKQINDLFESKSIDVCPLNSIRGRSLREKYLICDEAQNANAQLVKAVVTRAGNGTKIVIAGDIDQVDAPRLDKRTNGLVYCLEKMKGDENTAIISFTEINCERSKLAKSAIERMK